MISSLNFVLSGLEHEKCFITSGPDHSSDFTFFYVNSKMHFDLAARLAGSYNILTETFHVEKEIGSHFPADLFKYIINWQTSPKNHKHPERFIYIPISLKYF